MILRFKYIFFGKLQFVYFDKMQQLHIYLVNLQMSKIKQEKNHATGIDYENLSISNRI